MQMECLKIDLSHTLEFVRIKSLANKLCRPFPQRVKPQANKFLALDERLHIQYMYYLKKLCMCPVRLVDICRFL